MLNESGPKLDSSSVIEAGRAESCIFISGASAGSEAQPGADESSKDGTVLAEAASNAPKATSPTGCALVPSVSAATRPVGPARLPAVARRPHAWSDSTSTAGWSEAWTVVSLPLSRRTPPSTCPYHLACLGQREQDAAPHSQASIVSLHAGLSIGSQNLNCA